MIMFRFARPEILYFLLLIPFLVILFIVVYRGKKKALKRFGDFEVIRGLMPDVSFGRTVVKFIFLVLAISFIILGLAGPQFGSKLQEVKRKGIEIVIALDVSNSMLAEDIQPNRLERAKQAISKLTSRLQNDKIGLIVFAGDAYTQIPVTTDYGAVKMFLSSVNTEIVPRQGTAIGSAIELAMNSFTPESEIQKAIIIITDGENHEDDAIQAAKEAAGKGIVVYTLGMGLPQGGPIPVKGSYGQKTYKKNKQGNVVVSKLNEKVLQQIAAAGTGTYVRANNTQVGLEKLMDKINALEKTEFDAKVYADYDERYQYLLGLALLFLMLDFMVLEKKNRWLKRFDLFNVKD